MRKFVAFAVAAVVAAGSTAAMAQCQSCQQNQVFAQPVYSAPVYSAPVAPAPVYSAPVQSEVVYSAPLSYPAAPAACSSCSGGVVYGGTSYGSESSTLTVGSVINGETVVSVGETVVTGTTEGSGSKNMSIEGSVEPTSDGGEVVAPPAENAGEITPPTPDEA